MIKIILIEQHRHDNFFPKVEIKDYIWFRNEKELMKTLEIGMKVDYTTVCLIDYLFLKET